MEAKKVVEMIKELLKEERKLIIERTRINKQLRAVKKEINGMHNTIIEADFNEKRTEW